MIQKPLNESLRSYHKRTAEERRKKQDGESKEYFRKITGRKVISKSVRNIVFEKTKGRCGYCGCQLEKVWHIDHRNSISKLSETGKEITMELMTLTI